MEGSSRDRRRMLGLFVDTRDPSRLSMPRAIYSRVVPVEGQCYFMKDMISLTSILGALFDPLVVHRRGPERATTLTGGTERIARRPIRGQARLFQYAHSPT